MKEYRLPLKHPDGKVLIGDECSIGLERFVSQNLRAIAKGQCLGKPLFFLSVKTRMACSNKIGSLTVFQKFGLETDLPEVIVEQGIKTVCPFCIEILSRKRVNGTLIGSTKGE